MSDELQQRTLDEVIALKDLFLRRLIDDKVKMAAISQLKEQNSLLQKQLEEKNLISFIKELLLVCDRIDSQENIDELTKSVEYELLDLLARREVYRMDTPTVFDPLYHNAVSTVPETEEYPEKHVVQVVRHGYMFQEKVLRPADVIVSIGKSNTDQAK